MTHQPKFAAGADCLPSHNGANAIGCDGPVSSLNSPGVASCAPGLFPGDRHRANKLAGIHDAEQIDGWIKHARKRGDTEAEQAGLARKYEIERRRK